MPRISFFHVLPDLAQFSVVLRINVDMKEYLKVHMVLNTSLSLRGLLRSDVFFFLLQVALSRIEGP